MRKLSDIPKEEWERIYQNYPIKEIAISMRVSEEVIMKTLRSKGLAPKDIFKTIKYKRTSKTGHYREK